MIGEKEKAMERIFRQLKVGRRERKKTAMSITRQWYPMNSKIVVKTTERRSLQRYSLMLPN